MTAIVSAAEIKRAGGLQRWMAREARAGAGVKPIKLSTARDLSSLPAAKGRVPSDPALGYDAERMNGLEARYAAHLEVMRQDGAIVFWRFGAVKFRLADKTWYTPDFYIMLPGGAIEIHETKGWMRDDANVKIKVAAEMYPELTFVLVTWGNGAWEFVRYRSKREVRP